MIKWFVDEPNTCSILYQQYSIVYTTIIVYTIQYSVKTTVYCTQLSRVQTEEFNVRKSIKYSTMLPSVQNTIKYPDKVQCSECAVRS